MDIYLVDGTYELFRHFYAMPSAKDGNGQESPPFAVSWLPFYP